MLWLLDLCQNDSRVYEEGEAATGCWNKNKNSDPRASNCHFSYYSRLF